MNVFSVTQMLTPQMVTQAAVQAADGDGDGRTGAAALNDGDKAARSAAVNVISKPPATPAPAAPAPAKAHKVDVKA